MSNHYRLNVRFDLDDEAQRRAAEYLAELNNEKGKSRNRLGFIPAGMRLTPYQAGKKYIFFSVQSRSSSALSLGAYP